MNLLVGLEIIRQHSLSVTFHHPVVKLADMTDLRICDVGASEFSGQRLENTQNWKYFLHFVDSHHCDPGTAIGFQSDKAFGGQYLEGFAHRRA